MKKKPLIKYAALFVVLGLFGVAVAGCSHKTKRAAGSVAAAPPPVPVDVAPVKTGDIASTIPVVGNLQTLYDVNLSPVTAGRLIDVYVREGDRVKAGQVVARLDPTTAQAAVDQDEATVLSDVAKVGQAQAQYVQAKVNAQVAIANAQSALSAAKTSLEKTIVGNQPQQKQEAQDQVLEQQANYQNSLDAYNREKELYTAGAVALADLQNAQATYETQKALLDTYKQNLSQELEGGRPEDVATARQTVVQEQQNLTNAYAGRATIDVDYQAVVAAQATVVQAKATLASAQQDLANTNLVSPINGVVQTRSADPGQIAQPGTSVLEIVDLRTVYYEPTVSEDQFNLLAVGQPVAVNVDGYPGKTFSGRVTSIFPAASTTNRQFGARVEIQNSNELLRPGMFARGTITTAVYRNVVVIPLSAMQPQVQGSGYSTNETSYGVATGSTTLPPQMVYLVGAGNKAEARNIVLGVVNSDEAQVVSGLEPGDPLIVKGQGELQDGDPVKVAGSGRRAAGHAGSSPGGVSGS